MFVDYAGIAGMEPPLGIYHLSGFVILLVVAAEHTAGAHQHLGDQCLYCADRGRVPGAGRARVGGPGLPAPLLY